MSQTLPAFAPWPAAPSTGAVLVAHPAWEEARNFVLDRASEGPVTVALVGAPGAGKTWLLRELAGCLGEHGFPTMMLMQGNLPMWLSDNAALLVDETLCMPEPLLDELLTQDRAVVVLADVGRFGEVVSRRSAHPVIVTLRQLTAREVREFAAEWLRQTGLSPAMLEPEALARLVVHGRGTVGLIVQLLGAAVAMRGPSDQTKVTAADIDRAAEMCEVAPSPVAPPEPPQVTTKPRRSATPKILAATALAASVILGWALWTEFSPPSTVASAPTLAALPPLRPAETKAPALAVRSTPIPATNTAAAEVQVAEPAPAALLPRPEIARPAYSTAATLSPAPMATTLEATLPDPSAAVATRAPVREPELVPSSGRRGGPGIVLIAQRGDTLESLYRAIYRDRAAPPYADIVAANPSPLKPGAIVVFPEPPGGWFGTTTAEAPASERGRRRP